MTTDRAWLTSARSSIRYALGFVATILLVLPLGCAPARVRLSPDEVRAEFGRIGITTSESPPPTSFGRPMTSAGKAAGAGALGGFGGAILGGARTGNAIGLALGIAVSPLAAAGGAIYGAVAARSPEEVEQATQDMERAIAELNVQENLRDLVIARLAEVDPYLDVRPYNGPSDTVGDNPDTVIEVRVASVSLVGQGINPTLRLYLHAAVRVVKGNVVTHSRTIVAGGDGETFLTWAGENSQRFRWQVRRELQRLAEKIVADVLSRPAKDDPTPKEAPSSPLSHDPSSPVRAAPVALRPVELESWLPGRWDASGGASQLTISSDLNWEYTSTVNGRWWASGTALIEGPTTIVLEGWFNGSGPAARAERITMVLKRSEELLAGEF
jgi:hypothetical protein